MWSVGLLIGLFGGAGATFIAQRFFIKSKSQEIIKNAEIEAENIRKERALQSKEKFLKQKEEHEESIREREKRMQSNEDRVKAKEKTINQKLEELNRKEKEAEKAKTDYDAKVQALEIRQQELDKIQQKQVAELSKISNLSAEDAKNHLMLALTDEARTAAMATIKEITEEAKLNANKEARKIVIQSIQRVATEQAVEIIVDDTPEAIILSCFDPVRREIARLSLHQLVSDGRIHPARIEEVVGKTRKQLDEEIAETGRRTCIDLGIHGLHPELMRMVGRMKYRSSYGQNLLQHSREVANLCAIMAAELGLNVKLAKRAGLLHDIGKVPDEEPELPHAILGMKIAEKFGEKGDVLNAIGAHHDEIEMTTLISPIVQVCDAISGARPGARREIVEAYIKRIKELENLALSYEGVSSAYAIQAGRELRVLVEAEKVTDQRSEELSFTISQRIQTEMTYPGQVKVTVIREKRAVSYAK